MYIECADGSLPAIPDDSRRTGLCLEDLEEVRCAEDDTGVLVLLEDDGVGICWRLRLLGVLLNLEGESVLVKLRSLLRLILVIVSCW